jgi:hypothetical protein
MLWLQKNVQRHIISSVFFKSLVPDTCYKLIFLIEYIYTLKGKKHFLILINNLYFCK